MHFGAGGINPNADSKKSIGLLKSEERVIRKTDLSLSRSVHHPAPLALSNVSSILNPKAYFASTTKNSKTEVPLSARSGGARSNSKKD